VTFDDVADFKTPVSTAWRITAVSSSVLFRRWKTSLHSCHWICQRLSE